MTKEKAMYQAYLIIEKLPEEEKKLVPKEILENIQENMEYDENIVIDASIPMEKQKIDDKTWKILGDIIKEIEKSGYKIVTQSKSEVNPNYSNTTQEKNINEIVLENIKLTKQIQELQASTVNANQAKSLLVEYREALLKIKEENETLKAENEKCMANCEALINEMKTIPAFLRKWFIKDNKVKLLLGKD